MSFIDRFRSGGLGAFDPMAGLQQQQQIAAPSFSLPSAPAPRQADGGGANFASALRQGMQAQSERGLARQKFLQSAQLARFQQGAADARLQQRLEEAETQRKFQKSEREKRQAHQTRERKAIGRRPIVMNENQVGFVYPDIDDTSKVYSTIKPDSVEAGQSAEQLAKEEETAMNLVQPGVSVSRQPRIDPQTNQPVTEEVQAQDARAQIVFRHPMAPRTPEEAINRKATTKGRVEASKAEAKQIIEDFGEKLGTLQQENLVLDQTEKALLNPNVFAGDGAQALAWIKRNMHTYLGIGDPRTVSDQDLVEKMRDKLLANVVLSGGRAITNEDAALIRQSLSGITDTKQLALINLRIDRALRNREIQNIIAREKHLRDGTLSKWKLGKNKRFKEFGKQLLSDVEKWKDEASTLSNPVLGGLPGFTQPITQQSGTLKVPEGVSVPRRIPEGTTTETAPEGLQKSIASGIEGVIDPLTSQLGMSQGQTKRLARDIANMPGAVLPGSLPSAGARLGGLNKLARDVRTETQGPLAVRAIKRLPIYGVLQWLARGARQR